MAKKIQLRRDIAANWANVNPVLGNGEPGLETDTGKHKIGDGITAWELLDYSSPSVPSAQDILTAHYITGTVADDEGWPSSVSIMLTSDNNAALTGTDWVEVDGIMLYAVTDFAVGVSPTATLVNLANAIATSPDISALVTFSVVNYTGSSEGYGIFKTVAKGTAWNNLAKVFLSANFDFSDSFEFQGGRDPVLFGDQGTDCILQGHDCGIASGAVDTTIQGSVRCFADPSASKSTIIASNNSRVGGGPHNAIINSSDCTISGVQSDYCTIMNSYNCDIEWRTQKNTMIGCHWCDSSEFSWGDTMIGGYFNTDTSWSGVNIFLNTENCFLGRDTYGCVLSGLDHYVDSDYQYVSGDGGVATVEWNQKWTRAVGSYGLRSQTGNVIYSQTSTGLVGNKEWLSVTRHTASNILTTATVFGFRIVMSAIQVGGTAGTVGDACVKEYRGAVKILSDDTVSIVGDVSTTTYAADIDASTWGLIIDVDSYGLTMQHTGEINKTIVCTWSVETVECGK